MLQESARSWQLCCPACVHNGLHEQELMQQAAHLLVLSHHYGCLSDKLAQSCHWSVKKKCGSCFLCSSVGRLPFLPTPSMLKAKIEDREDNIVAFCVGAQLDQGAEERTPPLQCPSPQGQRFPPTGGNCH